MRPAFSASTFMYYIVFASSLLPHIIEDMASSRLSAVRVSTLRTPSRRMASQLPRQFHTSQFRAKEVRDAYILSAARTPTAKVKARIVMATHPF